MSRYHATPEGQIPFTPEEEAEWDALEAQVAAGEPDRKASAIREERDRLLTETDWVSLRALDASSDGLGIQLPMVWVEYRQALRDITKQPNFPDEVTWPVKPEQ